MDNQESHQLTGPTKHFAARIMTNQEPALLGDKLAPLARTTSKPDFFSPANHGFPYESVYRSLSSKGIIKAFPFYGQKATFRVVRILPGSGHDPIICELRHTRFGVKNLSYEALSYCAGSPSDCRSILLNGHKFNIFSSTFEALHRFRLPGSSRDFWIDQICINQTDVEERDSQVLLMADVYRHASCTQVWLGDAASSPPSRLAFEMVNDFLQSNRASLRRHVMEIGTAQPGYKRTGNALRDYLHAAHLWDVYYDTSLVNDHPERWEEIRHSPILQGTFEWFQSARNDPALMDSWSAFFEIFERSWWRRAWVVQEVVVSGKVILNCGMDFITWEDLSLALKPWYLISARVWEAPTGQDSELTIMLIACWELFSVIHVFRRAPEPFPLRVYLSLLRNSLASDARDKVYSVLGMLDERQRKAYVVVPNYASNNSKAELYTAIAEGILDTDADLQLFSDVCRPKSVVNLPSWVPDWSQPPHGPWQSYFVCFEAGSGHSVQMELLKEELGVKLWGYFIDDIYAAGPVDPPGPFNVRTTWEDIWLQHGGCTQDTTDQLLDRFYRCLNFDRWWVQPPNPNKDPESFRQYWDAFWTKPSTCSNRSSAECCFFVSKLGLPGLGTERAQANDKIFIPCGSRMPLVVRKSGVEGDNYELVGPCYLHGMMFGEVFTLEDEGRVKSEAIVLV